MKKTLIVSCMLLFSWGYISLAQDRTVSGIVSDENGEPLIGATVAIEGTSAGTITDVNGAYTLSVEAGTRLKFSFVGYIDRIVPVGNQTTINVQMEVNITQLSEIVVTALGISQEKRSLGYSIQEVKGNDIAQTQRPNFFTSLQGRVAGLSMNNTSGVAGSSVSITLRGVSSISGNNQPLIVVDGLPIDNSTLDMHNLVTDGNNRNNDYTNRAADINPNDIESITVLKGPEAAGLYGQDGASGAIIITTKKGTKGAGKITYDNSFGFQNVYRFPEVQTKYGLGNYGTLDNNNDEIRYFGPELPTDATIYNNTDAFFKTGVSQTHNLGIEGGSDAATYRFSLNYADNQGIVPTNHYQKLSARLTSSTKVAEKLEAISTLSYTLSNNIKPVRGAYGYLLGVLTWPSYEDMTDYLNPDKTRKKITESNYELDNPLFSVYKNHSADHTNRVMGNMTLKYDPIAWLNVTGRFGADIYSTQGDYFLHPESYQGGGAGAFRGGSLDIYQENSRLLNGQLLATGKKEFENFRTSLMFGTSFDDKNYEISSDRGESFLLKDFNSINNTDVTTQRSKNTLTRRRMLSVFSQFNASYSDLVYLNVTARNDWSSTLAPENRSFFYPSASLSFVFTELSALKNQDFISMGKVRASFAEVGKDVAPYRIYPALASRTTTGGGFAYNYWGGNTSLRPERSRALEFGTELKFINGRAGLDVAVYKYDRIDQVSTQRLSYGTGFIFGLLNGGHISTSGVEVQLSGSPVLTNEFEWSMLVNFTKNKSIVKELPAKVSEWYSSDTWLYGHARGSAYASNLPDFYNPENFPYYNWDYHQRGMGSATAIGGRGYQRNDNGDILINPANGLPYQTSDYLPIGERNPDFMIGFTNTLDYKNLFFSFLLDIRKGGDVYNANESFLMFSGLSASARSLDRETPVIFEGVLRDGNENSSTPTVNDIEINPFDEGSRYYGSIAAEEFIERDINWLRLRDITLGYNLPSGLIKGVSTISVFTTMTDLFMITNYSGADPVVNGTNPATAGAGAYGFDYGAVSLPRTISFGIRLGI